MWLASAELQGSYEGTLAFETKMTFLFTDGVRMQMICINETHSFGCKSTGFLNLEMHPPIVEQLGGGAK